MSVYHIAFALFAGFLFAEGLYRARRLLPGRLLKLAGLASALLYAALGAYGPLASEPAPRRQLAEDTAPRTSEGHMVAGPACHAVRSSAPARRGAPAHFMLTAGLRGLRPASLPAIT